jgi:heat shock protein HtpX
VISSALAALDECIGLLRPRHRAMTKSELLAGYLTWVFSVPFVLVEGLLLHLLFQDRQRAEYFADYLAASLAGTQATISVLRRFALGEHLHDVLLRNAYSTAQSGSYILDLFRQRIESLSAREWERMRRASEAEGAHLDRTHPPTAFRIAFLEAHPFNEPKFIVNAAKLTAIDAEFRALEYKLGRLLIARFARD